MARRLKGLGPPMYQCTKIALPLPASSYYQHCTESNISEAKVVMNAQYILNYKTF